MWTISIKLHRWLLVNNVYIGSLPKVHKSRVCVPPHFLAPCYAIAMLRLVLTKDLLVIGTLQNGGCLLIPRVVCCSYYVF